MSKKPNKIQNNNYSSFVEISIDPTMFSAFSNENGMSAYLSTLVTSEEFKRLRVQLIKEVMHVIETGLTEKQKEIIRMTYIDGKTQQEISAALGRHQTAIHKTLQGNIDYSNDKKRYGGALKKIKRLCKQNKKIQEILSKIKEKNEQYAQR